MQCGVVLLLVGLVASAHSQCLSDQDVLDRLLKDYDKELSPAAPTYVEVSIWISDLRIEGEHVRADLYVNERYRDERLVFRNLRPCVDLIAIGGTPFVKKFWLPKTTIINAVSQKQKGDDATFKHEFIALYDNGTFWRNVHMSVELRCLHNSSLFPNDSFNCTLTWESFQYNISRVYLSWFSQPLSLLKTPNVNGWTLRDDIVYENKMPYYPAGQWSEVAMTLQFDRRADYFFYQGYVPSLLCVIVAWMSMFLPRSAISARALLIMLSLALLFGLSAHLNTFVVGHKTGLTTMDVWVYGCVLFVLLALVKLTVVAEGCICRPGNTKDGYVAAEPDQGSDRCGFCGFCDWSFRLVYPLLFAVFALVFCLCC